MCQWAALYTVGFDPEEVLAKVSPSKEVSDPPSDSLLKSGEKAAPIELKEVLSALPNTLYPSVSSEKGQVESSPANSGAYLANLDHFLYPKESSWLLVL